jgi:hypothetical protein
MVSDSQDSMRVRSGSLLPPCKTVYYARVVEQLGNFLEVPAGKLSIDPPVNAAAVFNLMQEEEREYLP